MNTLSSILKTLMRSMQGLGEIMMMISEDQWNFFLISSQEMGMLMMMERNLKKKMMMLSKKMTRL